MTNKSSHTPGPWTIGNKGGYSSNAVFAEDGQLAICDVYGLYLHAKIDEQLEGTVKANAELIAAAPELLEALKEASEMFLGEYPCHPTTERILAAIKKAEG